MSTEAVVAFGLCVIIAAVGFTLWWGHDSDVRDLHDRVVTLEAALNLGGQPLAVVDPPTQPIGVPTEPMAVVVDVAGGLRTRRPTPYKRTAKGRHSA